ncbi:LPXTG cell wall anchor domain-containing protein [Enterococcus sp. DIV0756]|uniref:LPXTG cell wall anchor domain-containing protein n=1 Tax=Enterococcus sp. DIV0756 TaxID=2774636 RepID=UPI003F287359
MMKSLRIHKKRERTSRLSQIFILLLLILSISLIQVSGVVEAEENTVGELEILPGKETIIPPKHIPNGDIQPIKSVHKEASNHPYGRLPQTNMLGNQYALYGILVELLLLVIFILLLRRRRENDE